MSNPTRKTCHYCGAETDINTEFCKACGSSRFTNIIPPPSPATAAAPARAGGLYAPAAPKRNPAVRIISVIVAFIVIALILGPILADIFDDLFGSRDTGPTTSNYQMNQEIHTDWFNMTVKGVEYKPVGGIGSVSVAPLGQDLVLVEVLLDNYRFDEKLDMDLVKDFYIESSTHSKIYSKNTGGGYNNPLYTDTLNTADLFYERFMVSTGERLIGYIAYHVPRSAQNVRLVYEEWNYSGNDRTSVKHYYKTSIFYTGAGPNTITAIDAAMFNERAARFNGTATLSSALFPPPNPSAPTLTYQNDLNDRGTGFYHLIIETDYDGYGCYWSGAHVFGPGVPKENGREIYVVDFTRDTSLHNATVEYNNYVGKVKAIGGTVNAGTGTNFQYQINTSATRFGVSFRVDQINLYVVADIQYKAEIINFFDVLGYNIF
jgi:hypothetical protein